LVIGGLPTGALAAHAAGRRWAATPARPLRSLTRDLSGLVKGSALLKRTWNVGSEYPFGLAPPPDRLFPPGHPTFVCDDDDENNDGRRRSRLRWTQYQRSGQRSC
jgi:hypothetical protein